MKGDLQGKTDTEAAAFLQTWLFFGMISRVTDIQIDTDQFIRDDMVNSSSRQDV
jgi:hypothetical protein